MKKTTWKTSAALALALIGWTRFAEDFPSGDILPEVKPPPPIYQRPACKSNERAVFDASANRWTCVSILEGKPRQDRPEPRPQCKANEWARWDTGTKTWTCVPKL